MLKADDSTRINLDDPEVQEKMVLLWVKIKFLCLARQRIVHWSRFLLAGTLVGGFMSLLGLLFNAFLLTLCSLAMCAMIIPLSYLLSINNKKWDKREQALIIELKAFHTKWIDEKFEQLIQNDD